MAGLNHFSTAPVLENGAQNDFSGGLQNIMKGAQNGVTNGAPSMTSSDKQKGDVIDTNPQNGGYQFFLVLLSFFNIWW